MSAFAAVTIKRSQADLEALLAQAEPPLTDEQARLSFAEAPGGRGTELRVRLDQSSFGGAVGRTIATAVGRNPQQRLDDALRRFKQLAETGEIVVSAGSPGGTDAKQQRSQEPAQPADPTEPTD